MIARSLGTNLVQTGPLANTNLGELRGRLHQKSVDIVHLLTDIHDKEISDPLNIKVQMT